MQLPNRDHHASLRPRVGDRMRLLVLLCPLVHVATNDVLYLDSLWSASVYANLTNPMTAAAAMQVERAPWRAQAGSSAASTTGGKDSKSGDDRKKQKGKEGEGVARGAAGSEGYAGKAKPVRRGGARRRGKADKDRKLTTKDNGLKELLLLLATQVTQLTQRSRAMWGMMTKTVILDDSNPIVKAMQDENKMFAAGAQELRDKLKRLKDQAKAAKDDKAAEGKANGEADIAQQELRALGPPTTTVFAAMVEALMGEEVGRANRMTLEAWSTAMVGDPPDFVKLCRLENCYQQDMIKIVFSVGDQAKENVLCDSFKALGLFVAQGSAPAGYMEEELSAWIDVLKA